MQKLIEQTEQLPSFKLIRDYKTETDHATDSHNSNQCTTHTYDIVYRKFYLTVHSVLYSIWCVHIKSCLSITKLIGKWDEKCTPHNKQKRSFNSIKTQRSWIELPGLQPSTTSNWAALVYVWLLIWSKTNGVDSCACLQIAFDLIWFPFYLRINRLGWPRVGFNCHQFLTLANLATIKSYLFMSWWLTVFPLSRYNNMHLHWLLFTIETCLLRILFNWSQPYMLDRHLFVI